MKLKCGILLLALFTGWFDELYAQSSSFNRYIIEFNDKHNSPFSLSDPGAFLSQRSIDRRIRYAIPITENDLPVNPDYIMQVTNTGVKLLNKSKWLNSVSIQTDDSAALAEVKALPFVKNSYPIAPRYSNSHRPSKTVTDFNPQKLSEGGPDLYGNAFSQIDMLRGNTLHDKGYRGEGMVIAVMDVGFFNAPNLTVFKSLFDQGRVLGWWNFVKGNDTVFVSGGHGTSVLSTIAANAPGSMVGTAPEVSVYLFVTEDGASEYPIEEHNWAAGAEKADSLGADIITSSLGYSRFDDGAFNHTYQQMDGNTTMVTRAADFAASKGIIVCSSAGNEGNSDWFYITAPADADSILTVGAVDSLGLITSFSSNGPSSDGDVKPNVVAQGIRATVVEPFSGAIVTSNGTSFSNPVIAGMTACLWQAHPDKNNMEVIKAIERSSSLFFDPNDSMGYGIPNYEVADLILSDMAPDDLALTGPLIYPNPFDNQFSILYYTARLQEVQVEMFNLMGEKVQSFNTTLQTGYNYITVKAFEHAPKGLYFLRLIFDDHEEVVHAMKVQD
ncbi:MAG TPA: S8 family serine peptidase [Chitinophagales bacterium]|nr:S8 family serine peptidase [Chitinophagales bacterium]